MPTLANFAFVSIAFVDGFTPGTGPLFTGVHFVQLNVPKRRDDLGFVSERFVGLSVLPDFLAGDFVHVEQIDVDDALTHFVAGDVLSCHALN